MKNEKQAFLPLLAELAVPLVGGGIGMNLASKFLTPRIRGMAIKALTDRKKLRAAAILKPGGRAATAIHPSLGNKLPLPEAPTAIGRGYEKTLNWLGKRRNSDMISQQVGFTAGMPVAGMAASPLLNLMSPQPQQVMNKYSHEIFTGFMKAAEESGLSDKAISTLFKKAFSNESLTPDDVAKIRLALQEQGVNDPYSDPYGPLNSTYNQSLLRARDNSLDQVPELEAGSSAARKGLIGAGVGGLGGYALGSVLHNPGVLGPKVPYGLRSSLPTALGTSGAVIGALINALPAYKRRIDEIKGLQKLNSPENMNRLLSSVQTDKAILNS